MIFVLVFLAVAGWLAAHHFWRLNRLHVQAYQRAMDGWQQSTEAYAKETFAARTSLNASMTLLDEAKRVFQALTADHTREQLLLAVLRGVRDTPVTVSDRRNQ